MYRDSSFDFIILFWCFWIALLCIEASLYYLSQTDVNGCDIEHNQTYVRRRNCD